MNNKDLLNAIGEADDRFVEEAAPEERKAIQFGKKNKADNTVKYTKTNWKKWAGGVAAVLVVVILGATILPSLGGAAKKSDRYDKDYPMEEPQSIMENKPNGGFYAKDSSAAEMEMPMEDSKGSNSLISSSVANLNKQNLKLIYTANMELQTSDFAESEKALSALVEQYKGYFESVKVNNNGMYSTSTYKSAYYTVRIPAENYEAFINAVGDKCHVARLDQSVQDVGESYFEIEGRLETLYTKQERLQELLKQAGNMSDIIELENALSDTEYQIDNYKGRLNHYDSLIGYSTVYIDLETVTRPGSGISQDMSFGARLARAFRDGLRYTADNFEYFILWIAENLIGIIIFVVIVILLIRFRPVKKLWRKLRKKD